MDKLLTRAQLSELLSLYSQRDLVLSRNYIPGDWNTFMQVNARIAEILRPLVISPGDSERAA